ncbi:AMP-binding protein [Sphingomonas floccifaciens]|uniref:AMP-binding protein n=1 Tax=Sphingomonas floccifaciens TaxID=1844115 RepID=A0ABW4NIF5_9SPHN
MRALADVPVHFPADRVAIAHGDARWTYGDLDRRSAAWAATLVAGGVRPDDLVAFALPNGPEFFALTFGIYRVGATPAPLSPKLPAIERAAILQVMKPRIFVDHDSRPDVTCTHIDQTRTAASWKACTSGGSTGTPKVIVDARPAAFADDMAFIGIPADGVVLVPGPLYHNASFSAAVFALWRGSRVVTMDRFDAEGALALIDRERVDWSITVPTMLSRILALPADVRAQYDLSSWTMVVHTAAPMPEWVKRRWIDWRGPDHIWEVYGATEGLVRCWIGGRDWLDRPGSVGRPIGGARLQIVAEDGRSVPAGTIGEVFAMPPGGPGSTYRYIGAERRADPEGWESVGDCGWLDADGYLYLTDRRNDLIISGGINIWPAEVEAALLRHPDVRSCAVVGKPHADLGQSVHAILESDVAITLDRLEGVLDAHLLRAKWPRSIEVRATQVRDDAGKFRKSSEKAT